MPSSKSIEMLRRSVVDVGANRGLFCLEVAHRNPSVRVVAIEPVPDLAAGLRDAGRQFGLDNLTVVECAIGLSSGRTQMNVSSVGDRGISSTLELDYETISLNEYWAGRQDLVFSGSIMVGVRPLGEVLACLGICAVDFLKIDTQGLDLEVMRSLHGYDIEVRAGVLEAAASESSRLYRDEPTVREALNYLVTNGFRIQHIKPNDPASAELNVHFFRETDQWFEIVDSLSLQGIDIFDGQDYWYRPSRIPPHLIGSEDDDLERTLKLREELWSSVADLKSKLQSSNAEIVRLRNDIRILQQRADDAHVRQSGRDLALESLLVDQAAIHDALTSSLSGRILSALRRLVRGPSWIRSSGDRPPRDR